MTTETKISAAELEADLAQFTGSENYYRHWTNKLVYTDGVQYLAEKAGAYWLIDLIASWQIKKSVREQPFQLWLLTVNREAKGREKMARAACFTDTPEQDDSNRVCFQDIEFTDFPLDEIKLLLCDGVLMLPSEY